MKHITCLIGLVLSFSSYSQSFSVSSDTSDYLELDTTSFVEDFEKVVVTDNVSDSITGETDAYLITNNLDTLNTSSLRDSINKGSVVVLPSDSSIQGESIVVSDSLTVDSAWVNSPFKSLEDSLFWRSVDTMYAVFSATNVDPYGYDGAKFKDTLDIDLCAHHDENDTICWSMPMDSVHHITSNFGERRYKWHYGVDLRLNTGDSIRSVFDGVVRISKYNPGGYGYYVMVRHKNGLETIYGHLSKRIAQVGDEVKAGEVIGLGGSTGRSSGPHLHFEVRYRGDAIDPNYFYDFSSNTLKKDLYTLTPKDFDYIRVMRQKVYHRIRSGDTLGHLARKYRTSTRTICRLNGISTRTTLRIGRVLRVR